MTRRLAAFAAFALVLVPATARAQLPASQPADCTLVSATDATAILGYSVDDPDETSRAGGVCFYATRSLSEDGDLSYALVTPGALPARRRYYGAQERLCGNVAPTAPRAHACASFAALAAAEDVDQYYEARSHGADAAPVAGLGRAAVATADGLFVRGNDVVVEIVVRRGGATDVARETELARRVLARLAGP